MPTQAGIRVGSWLNRVNQDHSLFLCYMRNSNFVTQASLHQVLTPYVGEKFFCVEVSLYTKGCAMNTWQASQAEDSAILKLPKGATSSKASGIGLYTRCEIGGAGS